MCMHNVTLRYTVNIKLNKIERDSSQLYFKNILLEKISWLSLHFHKNQSFPRIANKGFISELCSKTKASKKVGPIFKICCIKGKVQIQNCAIFNFCS